MMENNRVENCECNALWMCPKHAQEWLRETFKIVTPEQARALLADLDKESD